MLLNFGGFIPLSTVDFPGRSCCTIFFRGCHLRCGYCHNKELWEGEDRRDIAEIKDMILSSEKYISGVAFSGGEPMEQPEPLNVLLEFCRSNDLATCLHTNGLHDIPFLDLIDMLIIGVKPGTKSFGHDNVIRLLVEDGKAKKI
jgi:pyruvate formate lyase activating enzyme